MELKYSRLLLCFLLCHQLILIAGSRITLPTNDESEIFNQLEENSVFPEFEDLPDDIDVIGNFFEEHYENAIDQYEMESVESACGSDNAMDEDEEMIETDEDGFLTSIWNYLSTFWSDDTSEAKRKSTELTHRTLHWFRKGLRLHDNPALLAALEGSKEFRPIFILDPHFVRSGLVGINRWRFLMESLRDLDRSFQMLGSRLYVLQGTPSEVFPRIFKEWNITRLTFEMDTEPYAKIRDEEVCQLAAEHGVEIVKRVSHTLYVPSSVIKSNGGKPPLTYQRFQTVLSKMGAPAKPRDAPTRQTIGECETPVDPNHDSKYGVPTLEQLGLESPEEDAIFPGGETEALQRMNDKLERKDWVCSFEKPKTEPNSLEPSTTVLSPYLKFGCLSPRKFYYALQEIYQAKKNYTKPPVSLLGQLLWREFYYVVASGTPNFHQMKDNPVCLQVPWDNNTEHLEAWKNARTGYPFIDAIMTQLRQEGWIHHLARHAVACFLTRGDLWISWEEGQKVFEELLLDADYSLNAGNWMWLSASAFFHQYFRVYSPIVFGKKTDPTGQYIKKYLPVLSKIPHQYIYEPWNAPRSVQEKADCIIGEDYPRPIVMHSDVLKRNIARMKEARACHYGEKAKQDKKRKSEDKNTTKGAKKSKKSK